VIAALRANLFDRRAVITFERLLGMTFLLEVATQVRAGVWYVHSGRYYPWRHIGILPLYSTSMLALEWALTVAAALALVLGAWRRVALRVLVPLAFVSVLERFSNHGALLAMVTFFAALAPADLRSPTFEAEPHPNLGLARAQLVIVYVFSALNKLTHGFVSGDSLVNLVAIARGPAVALSWAVVLVELALPVIVVLRPRVGIALVAITHAAFAAVIPGVATFGLLMVALAVLFLPPKR
jgi:hypothetical protein